MGKWEFGYPIARAEGRFGSMIVTPENKGHSVRKKPVWIKKQKVFKYRPTKCECAAWQLADAIYQTFTPAQKAVWANGLKRRHRSSYDLWMKESLTCLNRGELTPSKPSISGGFSTDKVVCDGYYHPPCTCTLKPVLEKRWADLPAWMKAPWAAAVKNPRLTPYGLFSLEGTW